MKFQDIIDLMKHFKDNDKFFMFLKNKQIFETKNDNGEFLLSYLCFNNYDEQIIKQIILVGDDVNRTDEDNLHYSPIRSIIHNPNDKVELVKLMHQHGANLESNMFYINQDNLKILDYFVQQKINLNSQNNDGFTLLHIMSHSFIFTQKLLNLGCDPTIKDNNGFLPYDYVENPEIKKLYIHNLLGIPIDELCKHIYWNCYKIDYTKIKHLNILEEMYLRYDDNTMSDKLKHISKQTGQMQMQMQMQEQEEEFEKIYDTEIEIIQEAIENKDWLTVKNVLDNTKDLETLNYLKNVEIPINLFQ